MTPEEYQQKKRSIESLSEQMEGNTPKKDIEEMKKDWMEELEMERDSQSK